MRHRPPRGVAPWAGGLVVVCFTLALVRTGLIVPRTGAVDFRNRVVAARVALAGHDPYTWKWSPGDPERLLDPCDGPHNPDHRFTRLTSPPTALLWIAPLAGLDYRVLKWINFAVSWGCVGAALVILRRLLPARSHGVVALFLGGFLLGMPLEYHMERGQQYTHFVLLWLLAALWERGGRRRATTVALGVNAALRPPNAVGLLAARGPREAALHLGVAAALVAGSLTIVPPRAWASYPAATRSWFQLLAGGQQPLGRPPAVFPAVVEGDPTLPEFVAYGGPRGVVHEVLAALRLEHSAAGHWAVVAAGMAAFVTFHRLGGSRPGAADLAALAWLVDLALPAPRCIYNDVLLLSFVPFLLARLGGRSPPLAWGAAATWVGLSALGRHAASEAVWAALLGLEAALAGRASRRPLPAPAAGDR